MSGLINKAKDAMGSSGSSSGGGQPGAGGQNQDYVDKGVSAGEKKFGLPQNQQVNEKVTDAGRDMYEKQTGKNVSDKISN